MNTTASLWFDQAPPEPPVRLAVVITETEERLQMLLDSASGLLSGTVEAVEIGEPIAQPAAQGAYGPVQPEPKRRLSFVVVIPGSHKHTGLLDTFRRAVVNQGGTVEEI